MFWKSNVDNGIYINFKYKLDVIGEKSISSSDQIQIGRKSYIYNKSKTMSECKLYLKDNILFLFEYSTDTNEFIFKDLILYMGT